MSGMRPQVTIGLERLVESVPKVLQGASFGLLMNQASVDSRFQYSYEIFEKRLPGQLVALFGPQHGLWSQQQDNMIETPHGFDLDRKRRIHSLYADCRKPTPEMLAGLDCLVVDLQDVGTRVYTYIWTVAYCMQACAQRKLPVLVLDRPNPLGGLAMEGPMLQPDYASFVGLHPIPMRHALTVAELAAYLNCSMGICCDLHTVAMDGWKRGMHWDQTGRVWIAPSPNLPRTAGVDVYPGQVILEGTNLSEGRGTTTPFEICGAPFIDARRLIKELEPFQLKGVVLRPVQFEPTFQKWKGQNCQGLALHVVDRQTFAAYRTTLALLACIRRLWPDQFAWREPPYEYETALMPIDILTGASSVRKAIDAGATPAIIDQLALADRERWRDEVRESLIYDDFEDASTAAHPS